MAQQELYHYGILGMKWGHRRFQNEDGSLTDAGRKRYGVGEGGGVDDISTPKGIKRRLNDLDDAMIRNKRQAQRAHALREDDEKERFIANINKGREESRRLIARAIEKGYSVEGNQRMKLAISNGEKFVMGLGVAGLMISPLAGGATIGIMAETDNRTQTGWKYKVTDTPDGKPTAKYNLTERNVGEKDRAAWAKADEERKLKEKYNTDLSNTSYYRRYKKRFRG